MDDAIMVRMGEIAVTKKPGAVLTALGLGSCIGVCAYDPATVVGGMAHVVLPKAIGSAKDMPGKSADIALPSLIEEMIRAGAKRAGIRLAIAGGASLFSFKSADTQMDIGNRNCDAIKAIIKDSGLRLLASDLGGSSGRTLRLYVDTGAVCVRRAGESERSLADLAGR
ncbi:MAG: chemotaxis protein CheD [Armatimonadota bacterium]